MYLEEHAITTPSSDSGPQWVTLSPHYLAATPPSDHRTYLHAFAEVSGWKAHESERMLTVASPCDRVVIRHDQQAQQTGEHLTISARSGLDGKDRWRAVLSGVVPVEYLLHLTLQVHHVLDVDPDYIVYGLDGGPGPEPIFLDIDEDSWALEAGEDLFMLGSADGIVTVANRRDGSTLQLDADPDVSWHIGASGRSLGMKALWRITFTEDTPPAIVNATLDKVLDDSPAVRAMPTSLPPALHPHVRVQQLPTPSAPTASASLRPTPPSTTPGGPSR
ncbi:DUF317 domain-containing protein [Streptomyces sp. CA-294286]|uniref:DUF317 domain-containing protein n=1 Tax=Streptomyces sp. CA-294286 TaxID=3240070 RepID=UPI003D8E6317